MRFEEQRFDEWYSHTQDGQLFVEMTLRIKKIRIIFSEAQPGDVL